MDRDLVQSGRHGQVEFCDLYSADRKLIHVKRYSGSSTMSHLFNQGVVSAQLLHGERVFRVAVNEKLPESHQLGDPAAQITPSDFEVAYAVIAKPGKELTLPFFSRLTLRNAVQVLRGLGFGVTLTSVPNVIA